MRKLDYNAGLVKIRPETPTQIIAKGSFQQPVKLLRKGTTRRNRRHSLTLVENPRSSVGFCRKQTIDWPSRDDRFVPIAALIATIQVLPTVSIVALCACSGERRERSRTDISVALWTRRGIPPSLARGAKPLSYTNHIGYDAAIRLFDMVRCRPRLRCPASRKKPDAWKARKSRQVSGFIKIW